MLSAGFVDAIDDRNPLYWDDEFAVKSKYGGLIAPPGFFGWPVTWDRGDYTYRRYAGLRQSNDEASRVWRFRSRAASNMISFIPIKAGDVLSSVYKVIDIVPREGKTGTMYFITTEITYTNKNSEIVAKVRFIMIYRRG